MCLDVWGFSCVCLDVGTSVLCASMCGLVCLDVLSSVLCTSMWGLHFCALMCELLFCGPRCGGFSSVYLDVLASVLCVGFSSVCLDV